MHNMHAIPWEGGVWKEGGGGGEITGLVVTRPQKNSPQLKSGEQLELWCNLCHRLPAGEEGIVRQVHLDQTLAKAKETHLIN